MSGPRRPVAVLAGGLATRLRPLTATIPKALVEVSGEPFIAHQLRLLRKQGLDRVVICAGYLGDMIRDWVGDGARFGLEVAFSFDGPTPLGTAGAIRKARTLLGDSFFVLYGDAYLRCDHRAVEVAFEESGCPALMTVFRNENRGVRSNVEFRRGRILVYDKEHPTPRMRHLDYGLTLFESQVFADLSDDTPQDLAAVYRDLLARGRLAAYEVRERFYEIGSPEGLAKTRRYLRDRAAGAPAATP